MSTVWENKKRLSADGFRCFISMFGTVEHCGPKMKACDCESYTDAEYFAL
jgi:hypothetical protein